MDKQKVREPLLGFSMFSEPRFIRITQSRNWSKQGWIWSFRISCSVFVSGQFWISLNVGTGLWVRRKRKSVIFLYGSLVAKYNPPFPKNRLFRTVPPDKFGPSSNRSINRPIQPILGFGTSAFFSGLGTSAKNESSDIQVEDLRWF